MRLVILADAFPPMRSSAAVLIRDLALYISRLNHQVSVVVPSAEQNEKFIREKYNGLSIVRVKVPKAKEVGHVRRFFAELLMPFYLIINSRGSGIFTDRWNGVIWYSPTIFFGLCINWIPLDKDAKKYLIVRDMFPDWAVDVGVMKKGAMYLFLRYINNLQYRAADFIGIQSQGNLRYFEGIRSLDKSKVEVLPNWLSSQRRKPCRIDLENTNLVGRKIFIYAGNMGVAQGVDVALELAADCLHREDLAFIFVGRGSEVKRLHNQAKHLKLHNVMFFDEVDPDEIASLYGKCFAGLVLLDRRHRSHNIPGKFLSYLEAGLPVLANINSDNDLAELIRREGIGKVTDNSPEYALKDALDELIEMVEGDTKIHKRCQKLFEKHFCVTIAAKKIMTRLL